MGSRDAKHKYYSNVIAQHVNDPKILFKVINSVINPMHTRYPDPSILNCEDFLNFFNDKIVGLHSTIPKLPVTPSCDLAVPCSTEWREFDLISLPALADIVAHLKPSSSKGDVLSPHLFKQIFTSVGTTVLNLTNKCLSQGICPAVFKHATVLPLLKRPNLAIEDPNNFRPISNLPFLAKVLEKVVLKQLQTYITINSISEPFQSGFKSCHSTETVLVKVLNDIFVSLDNGSNVILILLDLSAAFDMVDHETLINRLEHWVGLKDNVLKWFKSYLTDRFFSVNIESCNSSSSHLPWGVPQGSILAPILFSLYMLPLGAIFRKYKVSFHCYADDTQIYLPVSELNSSSIDTLLACLYDVKDWMAANFLKLNENKTEVIVFGPKKHEVLQCLNATSLTGFVKSNVKNLGFVLDSDLKVDRQINAVVRSCFFNLRLLAKTKPFLSSSDFERAITSIVFSRMDYCNSLYYGVEARALMRLQKIQNAAAKMIKSAKKYDSVTPLLISLKWLPVRLRIDYKILVLVFKALHNLAPVYLSSLVKFYTPSRSLRSENQYLLCTTRTKYKHRGDRAFSRAGPKLWNDLPYAIRSAKSLYFFKVVLKQHLLNSNGEHF